MPGIQLPIGIETVNPVDADYKRGPWPTIAAALAGINIALRYNNLSFYVVGDPNEYYWLDTDLSDAGLLIRSSGGSSLPISITRAALLALIGGSTVAVGTVYSVTDAQDALGGTITVLGTAIDRVDGNGNWSFVGKLPAQGRFRLATGTSGSVDQITMQVPINNVNTLVSLMTAVIPYTTSRNNTAALVVANINANTAVSRCRAYVIPSTTSAGNFDTPLICIEALDTTTLFVHTMTVTLTTLTLTGQQNPVLGYTPNDLILPSFYDLTNDRILSARDISKECSVTVSLARITALGYNPITTFRWRDVRFTNMRLIESGYINTSFRSTTGGAGWRNITWTTTSCDGVIFGVTASSNINLLANSSLLNINCISTQLNINEGIFVLQNVETTALTLNNNKSNITITTSTNLGTFQLVSNTGNMSLIANTCANNFIISSTTINPNLTLSINTNTITGPFTLLRNRINKVFTIQGSTTVPTTTIQDNDINGDFILINNTYTVSMNIRNNIILANTETLSQAGFSISGSTLPLISVIGNTLSLDFNTRVISPTTFSVQASIIDSSFLVGTITLGPFNILNSQIGPLVELGTFPLVAPLSYFNIDSSNITTLNLVELERIDIATSTISNTIMNAVNSGCACSEFVCADSELSNIVIYDDIDFGFSPTDSIDLYLSKCVISNSTIQLGIATASPQYTSCIINNSTVALGVVAGYITTSTCTDSTINNSILKLRATSGTGLATLSKITLQNSSLLDENLLNPFTSVLATDFSMDSSIFTVYTGDLIILECKLTNTKNIILNTTIPDLRYTTIYNGKYTLKYTHDFTVNPIPINSFYIIGAVLKDFVYEQVTYTSGNSLVAGAGATLTLDTAQPGSDYINAVLYTTINAAGATRNAGLFDRLAIDEYLKLNAQVGGITAGKLSIVLEGQLLQD